MREKQLYRHAKLELSANERFQMLGNVSKSNI